MRKEEKSAIIEQIAATVKQYGNFYLTDIATLNAEKTGELRKTCFKQDVKLMVVKNTLLKLALESIEGNFSELYGSLKGNTALMLCLSANTPAKLIKEFSRGIDVPKLKAAYVQESVYVGAENLDALISIKSKNELIGEVIGLLQSPAKQVISALQSGGQTLTGVLKTLSER
ncbi:MAG: 50S ribosomal protein L10 [Tannerellaceae bacterium]|jgi:large subunit ribosomal protein L10|nr:50S ribosomal protein L10 [Tannerellaceae bacterium]